MATELQIDNLALRLIGAKKITSAELAAESNEQARALVDVYDIMLDELEAAHPWNFTIKRAALTQTGGVITTWADNGSNVWYATLAYDPSRVEFDNTEGTEKTSYAACTAEGYWFWDTSTSKLYVYSTSDPDTAYDEIEAFIPEFDWDYAFALPSGCLRVIKMEDDAEFVREGELLFTDESEATIQYIAQITDTTKFPPAFVSAFAARLAAEIAFPITNDPKLPETMYKFYLERLRIAKAMDAQEGKGSKEENLSWEDARG